MELSIDTSTGWGGVAVSKEGKLLAEITWKPGHNHTVELYPNISRLLEAANTDTKSITAVFVAMGPGSFNGLRAGISAAKGLAFSLGIPLKGVSTLEVEAYPFAYSALPVCPIHDAGRGEIAAALYQLKERWQCLREEHLTTVARLPEETTETTVFCGEIPAGATEAIKSMLGDRAVIPGAEALLRRPAMLAALGWQYLQANGADNLSTLQPIYLRQPPITQRKKKY
jgi:tRNA threonylcarbamoyl adenosine modification protein YeaZ